MRSRLTGLQSQIRSFVSTNLGTFIQTINNETGNSVPTNFIIKKGYMDPEGLSEYPVIMSYLENKKPDPEAVNNVILNIIIATKADDLEVLETHMEVFSDAFNELQRDFPKLGTDVVDTNIVEELFFSPLTGGKVAVNLISLQVETDNL